MFDWKGKKFRKPEPFTDADLGLDDILITGQSGFVAGTHVASNLGWCPVEALRVGDKVLSFDHGMQTVVDIQRETLTPGDSSLPDVLRPVLVPRNALNNRRPIWLMPEQGLLLDSDAALEVLDDPFAVVPARALAGFRGIRTAVPGETLSMTTLAFDRDEVVYVEGGLLSFCPYPRTILDEDAAGESSLYTMQSYETARYLVQFLIDEDNATALTYDPSELELLVRQEPRPPRPMRVVSPPTPGLSTN